MIKKVHKKSAKMLGRAQKVLAGGVSSEFRKYNYPHALFYAQGKGSRIYDVDGNEYLDFALSQGPMLLGHSHPTILQAVNDYSQKGQLFAGQHIKELELAEKIYNLIPCADLMRFCLSGSTAIQTALRVARAKTGKTKFLRFEGHYHGWLDNVAWGLSVPPDQDLGSRSNPNVFPWTEGLAEYSREEFEILPWNDLELVEKSLAEKHHEIAAIITEPVMCNNGCIMPNPGFLEGLRHLCDKYNIALIFDEVITGFRLSLGGAQSYFGVTPDLAVFAKAMANGYPISAVVGQRDWLKVVEESKVIHAGTMNAGNPAVAAALATINVLEKEQPYERLFQYGKLLMEGIQSAAKETNQNLLITGPGPMFCTAFTDQNSVKDYRDTLSFDQKKLNKFVAAMHEKGIRIIGRGLWYIGLAHDRDDIEQAIEIVRKVLKELK